MSRINPHENPAPLYALLNQVKTSCLQNEGSILDAGRSLWTLEHLDTLDRTFVQNPDMGSDGYFEKLKLQVMGGPPESRMLMAELHWLLFAFPSDTKAETKAQRIREVWSWSGQELPPDLPPLSPAVLHGIGHTGTAFGTHRWREMNFLIGVMRALKALSPTERQAVLADGPGFAGFLDGVKGVKGRQLRHILPHLFFPDTYERISSPGHKRDILVGFERVTAAEARKLSTSALDEALALLRGELETKMERGIDFYDPEVEPLWRGTPADWLLSWNPTNYPWENFVGDCRKTAEGEEVVDNWRCSSGGAKVGDRVWLARTGVEPRGILGRGRVTKAPHMAPHWVPEKAAAGETAQMIGVAFEELRPIDQPFPSLVALEAAAPGQVWNPQASGIAIKPAGAKILADLWDGDAPPAPTMNYEAKPMPLNTILYGPPGTGKTHATTRRAVEICDGQSPQDEQALRERYLTLRDQGRIAFVTFHQSYSYEDFVEGLRPKLADEGPGFSLEPKAGILKTMADRARTRRETRKGSFDNTGKRVFKVSLGRANVAEDAYLRDECLVNGEFRLGYGGEIDWSPPQFANWQAIFNRWKEVDPGAKGGNPNVVQINQLRNEMRVGDVVIASKGNMAVQAIGLVKGPYVYDATRSIDEYRHLREVDWVWKAEGDKTLPASDFSTKGLSQVSIYQMGAESLRWDNLLPYLEQKAADARPLPHVLIIDEINRANISKVMGELITLLEEDKREGAPNEVKIILPASQDPFTLPRNLFILGTMNTADRSIALIDTALRRRFHFEELAPKPSELANTTTGVDLVALLEAINGRLEYHLGPDLLIGHAWFMGLEDRAALDAVMSRKVIPLLREYFHEDVELVRHVLGGGEGFLRRLPLKTPNGQSEQRYRYIDRFTEGGYPDTAYAEATAE